MKTEKTHTPLFFISREFSADKEFLCFFSTRESGVYLIGIDKATGEPSKGTSNDIMLAGLTHNLERQIPAFCGKDIDGRLAKFIKECYGVASLFPREHKMSIVVFYDVLSNTLFVRDNPYYHDITARTEKPILNGEEGIVIPFALDISRSGFVMVDFNDPSCTHYYKHKFTCKGELHVNFNGQDYNLSLVWNVKDCAVTPSVDCVDDDIVILAVLSAVCDKAHTSHFESVELHKREVNLSKFVDTLEKQMAA